MKKNNHSMIELVNKKKTVYSTYSPEKKFSWNSNIVQTTDHHAYESDDVERMEAEVRVIQYSFSSRSDCLCGGANACIRCNPSDYI